MKLLVSRHISIGIIILLVLGFAGYAVFTRTTGQQTNKLAVSQSAATKLPKESPNVPTLYLAKGLLTPTNKWFSSLAFSAKGEPVYPYPLSYSLTANGYSVSNPPVVSSANAIIATNIPDVMVNLQTPLHVVESYDDLSVVVAQQSQSGQTIAETRITHGSPYVYTTMQQSETVTITSTGTITKVNAHAYLITLGTRLYGIYTQNSIILNGQNLEISAIKGSDISVFTLPNISLQNLYFTYASRPITGTSISYTTTASNITTNYNLRTADGRPTLFAITPDMNVSDHQSAGTFATILGKQHVLIGNSFTDVQKTPTMPSPQLPLGAITTAQKAQLISLLKSDTANLKFTQTDTYFGGKELYRAANLLELAEDLNQPSLANSIKTKLAARLSEWYDPTGSSKRNDLYFYYDTSYDGVVGVQASFGSDSFNDHDFHYGYFIYASAILSKYDSAFYKQYAPMVNVLISDLASTEQTSLFPKLRYFDAYVGHSWASGNGEFADGNNQESSSEAINAWYGMYLWSQVSNNKTLQTESIWLYEHETKAAQTEWLNVNTTANLGPTFQHTTAGIIWGDKIDYSTFFSARPQDVLGIQLIPMSPGSSYLSSTNIDKNINSVITIPTDLNGQFEDYLIMYQALSNPKLALQEAPDLTAANLDSANSMTYFYAWLFSHNQTAK
jgi:endo-1,3(4)-beta-glucanase